MSPMPARRACRWPGCGELAVERGRCGRHPAPSQAAPSGRSGWQQRPAVMVGQRTRGRAWMAIRAGVLAEEPRCYLCGGGGTNQDYVDHVLPLSQGGTDDRGNLRRICRPCSDRKTGRESRGERRGGGI